MTQSHSGRVCNRLVAITRPLQICQPCARRHDAHPVTRGARLRSWMEGWRVSCPICRTALEDFGLYTRLFRADPADALLVSIESNARDGERIMDRAFRRSSAGSAHSVLMRSFLLPQTARPREAVAAAPVPRILDLVVPGGRRVLSALATGKLAVVRPVFAAERPHSCPGGDRTRVEPARALDRQVGRRCSAAAPGKSAALLQGAFVVGSHRAATSHPAVFSDIAAILRISA